MNVTVCPHCGSIHQKMNFDDTRIVNTKLIHPNQVELIFETVCDECDKTYIFVRKADFSI